MRSDARRAAASFSGSTAVAVLLFAALGLSPDPAHSRASGGTTGNPIGGGIKATDLRGEWLRAGPGFACKVGVGEKLPPELINSDILARACLHMGPFVIGDDAQALVTALGAPHRALPQPNGAKASIYFLEQAGQYPYLVATVSKNRIVALQVTGPVAAKGYAFNHIDLGAATDTLVQYFGQPNHLEPSSEKGTELWAYRPWPFSFEIRDGHVTSIRIADPTE
jgi:hypothetical protein